MVTRCRVRFFPDCFLGVCFGRYLGVSRGETHAREETWNEMLRLEDRRIERLDLWSEAVRDDERKREEAEEWNGVSRSFTGESGSRGVR